MSTDFPVCFCWHGDLLSSSTWSTKSTLGLLEAAASNYDTSHVIHQWLHLSVAVWLLLGCSYLASTFREERLTLAHSLEGKVHLFKKAQWVSGESLTLLSGSLWLAPSHSGSWKGRDRKPGPRAREGCTSSWLPSAERLWDCAWALWGGLWGGWPGLSDSELQRCDHVTGSCHHGWSQSAPVPSLWWSGTVS